jgi:UDP-3-O-[3-hydroxymyristoyl] glucosamine N-acyltransferase
VIIHSGTAIGSDGYGFVMDGGRHHKIPQVGGVVIEDDVEIGANCTIDRATLGMTRIKAGTKLDNLVHIAHNVTVGEHCLLTGQVGIAGSTTLGNYVVVGGQTAITDHVTIGDRVMIGGGSGIAKSVEAGQVVAGYPAIPLREWLKAQAVLPKLPELKKLVAQLQDRIEKLEKGS